MFGSCRVCYRPTDNGQDFCNECAVLGSPPRLRVIEGGRSRWERTGPKRLATRRWLQPVPRGPVAPETNR